MRPTPTEITWRPTWSESADPTWIGVTVIWIAVVLTLAALINWLSGSSWTTAETPPVRG